MKSEGFFILDLQPFWVHLLHLARMVYQHTHGLEALALLPAVFRTGPYASLPRLPSVCCVLGGRAVTSSNNAGGAQSK